MVTEAVTTGRAISRRRSPSKGRQRPNIGAGIAATLWLIFAVIPIYYVVITSFKSQEGFFSENALLPPASPTLDNYILVLQNDFFVYFLNSVIVTLATVVLSTVCALMAAYAIVRGAGSRWLGRTFSLFLLGLAIPLQAVIIPVYLMITRAGLYDSLIALILPSVAFALPLSIIILANFVRDIPGELYEAMRVDGASDWRTLTTLVYPMARPALATVAIYNGLSVWNGFIFALVLTQSPDKRVLPLALWTFQGEFTANIPAVLAAVVLSTLPIVLLYIVGRRQLIAGLTAGVGK